MNIVLIGLRCSGKTSVGRAVAARTGRRFLDTDACIAAESGRSIPDLVISEGWARFRELERKVVAEISAQDELVVATGGGVVMDGGNVKNLKRNGWMVWLGGEFRVLKARMARDLAGGKPRPGLAGGDPLGEIDRIAESRDPLYREAADLQVDTTELSVLEVAGRIIKGLPPGMAATAGR